MTGMGLEEEGHGHSPNPELIPGSGVRGDSSNRKMGWGGGNPMPKISTNTKPILILIPIPILIGTLPSTILTLTLMHVR